VGSVVENGGFNTSHLARTRFVNDGNTPVLDEELSAHLARAQRELGRELPEGILYYDFSDRPYDSNSYGSLGWGITTISSFSPSAPTYLELISDCLYAASMANA
jgi:hypothetical protein